MAENKKSFVLYSDLISVVEKLVFKDRENKTNYGGELFLHILQYVNDKEPIPVDFIIEMAFEPIKLQLKRDLQKYEVIKEKRSLAGKKSAEIKQQNATKSTSVEFVEQTPTNSTVNDSVNVNVTVNDNVSDILLEKVTKEVKFLKENLDEVFSDEISDEVKTGIEERKKVAPKKERYFNKDDFKKKLLNLGVEEKHANDWIQIRKDKKASFTESAIDGIIRECEKQNYPFPDAIRNCAENNWQGFKYEWLKNQNQNGQFGNNQSTNNGFSKNSGNTNGSQNGKIAARTILAQRLGARNTEEVSNGSSGNITIDAEVVK